MDERQWLEERVAHLEEEILCERLLLLVKTLALRGLEPNQQEIDDVLAGT